MSSALLEESSLAPDNTSSERSAMPENEDTSIFFWQKTNRAPLFNMVNVPEGSATAKVQLTESTIHLANNQSGEIQKGNPISIKVFLAYYFLEKEDAKHFAENNEVDFVSSPSRQKLQQEANNTKEPPPLIKEKNSIDHTKNNLKPRRSSLSHKIQHINENNEQSTKPQLENNEASKNAANLNDQNKNRGTLIQLASRSNSLRHGTINDGKKRTPVSNLNDSASRDRQFRHYYIDPDARPNKPAWYTEPLDSAFDHTTVPDWGTVPLTEKEEALKAFDSNFASPLLGEFYDGTGRLLKHKKNPYTHLTEGPQLPDSKTRLGGGSQRQSITGLSAKQTDGGQNLNYASTVLDSVDTIGDLKDNFNLDPRIPDSRSSILSRETNENRYGMMKGIGDETVLRGRTTNNNINVTNQKNALQTDSLTSSLDSLKRSAIQGVLSSSLLRGPSNLSHKQIVDMLKSTELNNVDYLVPDEIERTNRIENSSTQDQRLDSRNFREMHETQKLDPSAFLAYEERLHQHITATNKCALSQSQSKQPNRIEYAECTEKSQVPQTTVRAVWHAGSNMIDSNIVNNNLPPILPNVSFGRYQEESTIENHTANSIEQNMLNSLLRRLPLKSLSEEELKKVSGTELLEKLQQLDNNEMNSSGLFMPDNMSVNTDKNVVLIRDNHKGMETNSIPNESSGLFMLPEFSEIDVHNVGKNNLHRSIKKDWFIDNHESRTGEELLSDNKHVSVPDSVVGTNANHVLLDEKTFSPKSPKLTDSLFFNNQDDISYILSNIDKTSATSAVGIEDNLVYFSAKNSKTPSFLTQRVAECVKSKGAELLDGSFEAETNAHGIVLGGANTHVQPYNINFQAASGILDSLKNQKPLSTPYISGHTMPAEHFEASGDCTCCCYRCSQSMAESNIAAQKNEHPLFYNSKLLFESNSGQNRMSGMHGQVSHEAQSDANIPVQLDAYNAKMLGAVPSTVLMSKDVQSAINNTAALHLNRDDASKIVSDIDYTMMFSQGESFSMNKQPTTERQNGNISIRNGSRSNMIADTIQKSVETYSFNLDSVDLNKLNQSMWEYADFKGQIQGLFTSIQMRHWFECKFFTSDLLMRFHSSLPFLPFYKLYPSELYHIYPPFLRLPTVTPDGQVFHHIPTVNKAKDDQASVSKVPQHSEPAFKCRILPNTDMQSMSYSMPPETLSGIGSKGVELANLQNSRFNNETTQSDISVNANFAHPHRLQFFSNSFSSDTKRPDMYRGDIINETGSNSAYAMPTTDGSAKSISRTELITHSLKALLKIGESEEASEEFVVTSSHPNSSVSANTAAMSNATHIQRMEAASALMSGVTDSNQQRIKSHMAQFEATKTPVFLDDSIIQASVPWKGASSTTAANESGFRFEKEKPAPGSFVAHETGKTQAGDQHLKESSDVLENCFMRSVISNAPSGGGDVQQTTTSNFEEAKAQKQDAFVEKLQNTSDIQVHHESEKKRGGNTEKNSLLNDSKKTGSTSQHNEEEFILVSDKRSNNVRKGTQHSNSGHSNGQTSHKQKHQDHHPHRERNKKTQQNSQDSSAGLTAGTQLTEKHIQQNHHGNAATAAQGSVGPKSTYNDSGNQKKKLNHVRQANHNYNGSGKTFGNANGQSSSNPSQAANSHGGHQSQNNQNNAAGINQNAQTKSRNAGSGAQYHQQTTSHSNNNYHNAKNNYSGNHYHNAKTQFAQNASRGNSAGHQNSNRNKVSNIPEKNTQETTVEAPLKTKAAPSGVQQNTITTKTEKNDITVSNNRQEKTVKRQNAWNIPAKEAVVFTDVFDPQLEANQSKSTKPHKFNFSSKTKKQKQTKTLQDFFKQELYETSFKSVWNKSPFSIV